MSAGNPATGVGSSTPFLISRSLPERSVTSIVELPAAPGRNTMLHGWFSPFVTVILIGRTSAVSIISGPSGIGGDGQLIGGGAVAAPRPPPPAPCARPPPPAAGAAPCCWAATTAIAENAISTPQALRITLRMTDAPTQLSPEAGADRSRPTAV